MTKQKKYLGCFLLIIEQFFEIKKLLRKEHFKEDFSKRLKMNIKQ